MGALFRLLLLSWEIVVVINGVSAGCETGKGPVGDTDCVQSPLKRMAQAAVCTDWLFFPTGRCSWFTECLGKRVNCSSTIKAATERCNSLDTARQSVSKNGQEWVDTSKKCIQNNMIHYLYPQINLDCKNMREIMELSDTLSDTLCYREKLYESQFCKLTFSDVVTIHGFLSELFTL